MYNKTCQLHINVFFSLFKTSLHSFNKDYFIKSSKLPSIIFSKIQMKFFKTIIPPQIPSIHNIINNHLEDATQNTWHQSGKRGGTYTRRKVYVEKIMDRNIDLNIPANTDDGITMANETGFFSYPILFFLVIMCISSLLVIWMVFIIINLSRVLSVIQHFFFILYLC